MRIKDTLVCMSETPFVRGYLRGIVYDLPRGEFKFVSNELIDFVNEYHHRTISQINENQEEFLRFLIENEYAIVTTKKLAEGFTDLNTQWDYPASITNIHIELEYLNETTQEIIKKLKVLNCKVFTFEILSDWTLSEVNSLITLIEDSEIRLVSLIFHRLSFDNEFVLSSNKVETLTILNSKEDLNIRSENNSYPVISLPFDIKSFRMNQLKKPESFNVNISLYTESLSFNAYYNRKLFVHSSGVLKNGHLGLRSFGNLYEISSEEIRDIIKLPNFSEISLSKKDHIEVCQDCEFRYMCLDDRIPVRVTDDIWRHESECDYNPFICKWKGSDGYLNLKDSGVEVIDGKLIINHDKLNKVNTQLWD